MRRLVSALAVGGAILTTVVGVNPLATQAAGGTALPLANSLVLTNPVTGARAQMMPTVQWLTQHGIPYGPNANGAQGGSTVTTAGTLPAPTCTLATDSSVGDALVPIANQPATQDDALDISAFGLSTSSDHANLSAQLSAVSLTDGSPAGTPAVPGVTGSSDSWYVIWHYGTDPTIKGYFLEATYPATPVDTGYENSTSTSGLPVDFTWGTVTAGTGGIDQLNSGGAATGSFDTAHNQITISAPLGTLGLTGTGGTPRIGAALTGAYAQTEAWVGAAATGGLLLKVDTVNTNSADYQVGQARPTCPGAKTPPPTQGPTGKLPSAGSTNNLAYYGGPIVHTISNHVIWWLPQAGTTTYSDGSSCTIPGTASYSYEGPVSGAPSGTLSGGPDGDADYQGILSQYFKDVGGTAFYNLLAGYADEENGVSGTGATFGGAWSDHCGYTSTPTVGTGPTAAGGAGATPLPGGTQAAPIYQLDIENEVQKAIQVNHWPVGMGNEYFVYTGYGVSDCFAPPAQQGGVLSPCDTSGPNPYYCAYHGDFMDSKGNTVLYADMPDGQNPSAFGCSQSPIGTADPTHSVAINGQSKQVTDPIADMEVAITSHEQFETVNDAQVGTAQQLAPPLGWYDAANGEIGDKCAYNYGNYAGDGSNIVLHGDHYIVQQEYSNWNNGCALTGYQGNGGYGGDPSAVAIQKGQTLIGVPVSGITDTRLLAANMTRSGQLPAGSITQVQVWRNGALQTYIPGKSRPISLVRTDGILVSSNVAGTWIPSGTLNTSAPTIHLNPGWNLVAATYPNPGLMTDAIYNQVAAEAGACTAAILTNQPCAPTITEIKAIGANGATIDWKPAAPDTGTGNATWPQTYGNQIPYTSGMWIYAAKALTWTVQGTQCQSVDSSGVCH
jgi:hypothetical protein